MNRIARRALALWLLIGILLGGVGFFGYEYVMHSGTWVLQSGSPHVYAGGGQTISLGTVVDRDGRFLLKLRDGRTYASDETLRSSMLHWLGDRSGNIRGTALQTYAEKLAGFSLINGLYGYGGGGGVAELTLSSQVQKAALAALGSYRGTIAVMNYETGEILCAVSAPTFDPDAVPDLTQDAYEGVYWNRFTQASYVPGSIFKVVTTAAALEGMDAVEQRMFTCTGKLRLKGGNVTCERAHGKQDLQAAMKNSCNCYYADLTVELGADYLTQAVSRYALLNPITFDGITTSQGNFDVSGAAQVELAWGGIGQYTDLVNPCAFLCFVAAVANGGVRVQPHVVSSVSVGGKPTYQAQITRQATMLDSKTAAVLRDMLRNNVANGYGDENFPAGMTVCAKSGTGEVDGAKKSYAMFTGFVMEEEYPLAFIACVEDAGYGKKICMPMISQVLAVCKSVLDGK